MLLEAFLGKKSDRHILLVSARWSVSLKVTFARKLMNHEQFLEQASQGGSSSSIFAESYLQLCQLSYLKNPADIPECVTTLHPLNPGGSWACVWGPVLDSREANLVFVAVYSYAPGLPSLATVVIRGTDTQSSSLLGVLEQAKEDLDVTSLVPMPWDTQNPARIAKGTASGIELIESFRYQETALLDTLVNLLHSSSPVLVVTGHSLGGCLTSVVAPWLKTVLKDRGFMPPVVPCSFAGPTAGDAAFASYFQNCFSYSLRYQNSLDIIPKAWDHLSDIKTVYEADGLPMPLIEKGLLEAFEIELKLKHIHYSQPGDPMLLTGQFSKQPGWNDEAGYQHRTTTYMTLMGGTSVLPS
jgi:hypothetical protein